MKQNRFMSNITQKDPHEIDGNKDRIGCVKSYLKNV